MNTYQLTPLAEADVSDIWNYTIENWNTAQAKRYVSLIETAVEALAEKPKKGKPADSIRHGYRKWSVGSHVIYYLEVDAGIVVIRVLHQSMDVDRAEF
jgi:toxin ParE1/3/4